MRNMFWVAVFLFLFGCVKQETPSQFVLEGTVRLHKEVKENMKVKLEVCRHTKWIEDKLWETVTDKWGRYRIIVGIDWFGEHYRVRASAYDKYGNFYLSDWQYGLVRFTSEKKDIWLGEKQAVEEKKKVKRRRF
jgi:hypothetical protein